MRYVFKVGTSLLTHETFQLNRDFLAKFVAHVSQIHEAGDEVMVVTSGAVAAGRQKISFSQEKKHIPYRQALAAVGQGILMTTYQELFAKEKISVAQALLTNYDFVNRENFLNTQNVLHELLARRVIPIVNENDVTTIAELKFGDNDMLSAKTAAMISADHLFILTDVDGLFDADPRKNPEAKLISEVLQIDDHIKSLAGGARSKNSMGGMISKISAAQYAHSAGVAISILNGTQEKELKKMVEFCTKKIPNPPGTLFKTTVSGKASNKKWMRPKITKNTWIEVDAGAAEALKKLGKSLLPSGICKVMGDFIRGDIVAVRFEDKEIGYGQSNYTSKELDVIKKNRTDKIEQLLGYSFEEEAMHRDRMVVL